MAYKPTLIKVTTTIGYGSPNKANSYSVHGAALGEKKLRLPDMTLLKAFGDFQEATPEERNLRFGVREHGMGAICNGIALHSPGLIPYCATFFVFTD
ncbi:hypothetical protein Bca52824_007401 [Brassica carinata]|uniref:Uncharacterized protein n=1 Tax=Brassica carinata TaxID=52824 RepID=A0A8X7W9U9_BRACI|nr:hypothetical protein Bca52824_007401 [Brassica carinata]